MSQARSFISVIGMPNTFKSGGYPRDAIEIDPRADPNTDARQLADHLPGFVDEPTFFHGSLVAETPLRDPHVRHLPDINFPSDRLEDLQEQAEERILGFVAAWKRLAWLPARAQLLDALWWKAKLDLKTETLLTLVLCDGWSVQDVKILAWHDLDIRRGVSRVDGEERWILPHTLGLLATMKRQSKGGGPWISVPREDMVEMLRIGWLALVTAAKPSGRKTSPFPKWEQVLARFGP